MKRCRVPKQARSHRTITCSFFASPPSAAVLFVIFGLLAWGVSPAREAQAKQTTEAAQQPRQNEPAESAGVIVSHQGLIWLVGRLLHSGNPSDHVVSFVPPGATPETFEPTPSALAKLSRAQFFIASGVPYEKAWLPRIRAMAPKLIVIDAFAGRAAEASHQHGGGSSSLPHHHHHDPHLWSSPKHLKFAAGHLVREVARHRPLQAGELETRRASVVEELRVLETEIAGLLRQDESRASNAAARASSARRPFFVFHPAWGAFAEDFGLEQVALEEDGRSPGPAHIQTFVARMRASGARSIFVQPQMSRREADSLARHTGARVEVIDPLAADLPGELRRFAQLLKHDFDRRGPLAIKKP